MGLFDAIRRLFGRAEEVANEVDYAVLETVHRAEDALDHATDGRLYDAIEKIDEEADELGARLHLDDPRLEEKPGDR